jgi:hypothetical protein
MTHVESAELQNELPEQRVGNEVRPPSTPAERLAASREAIRGALTRRSSGSKRSADDGPRQRGWTHAFTSVFAHVPMSDVASRWINRWWARHPWRSTVEFAIDAADEIARPTAEKHPMLLIIGAVGAGALLSRVRPWRWISSGALLAGLLPRFQMASIVGWMTSVLREFPGAAADQTRTGSTPDATASFASPHPPSAEDAAPTSASGPAQSSSPVAGTVPIQPQPAAFSSG